MRKLQIASALVAVILLSGFGSDLIAQSLSGKQIIEKVYNRETGEDQTSDLTMTLTNKNGAQRKRTIKNS